MLEELSEYRKSSEAIVQQIAEVYATTDFDKMDEFNQKLLAFVEEGNFASADSLLKTQGDKKELFAKIKKEEAAIKKTEDEVNRAKEYNNKEKEALAQRLFSEHLMYLQKPMMKDSALYCLKMRADLDTTNISWTSDYANLCNATNRFDEAIKYYMISAKLAQEQEREDLSISILSEIPYIYDKREQLDEEFKLLTELIHRGDSIAKSNPNGFDRLDFLYWQLANYYQHTKQYDLAVECLNKCNNIHKSARSFTIVEEEYNKVENLGAKGHIYCNMFMPKEGLKYLQEGRELLDSIYKKYPNNQNRKYEISIEMGLGLAYEHLQEFEKALNHYLNSHNIQEEYYLKDPERYGPYLAETHKVIGAIYFYLGNLDNSIKYMEESAVLYEESRKKDPLFMTGGYCDLLNDIGYLTYIKGNYTKANEYYEKAKNFILPLYEQQPNAYAYNYVLILINQFAAYCAQKDTSKCGSMLKETEMLAETVYEQMPDVFARSILIMYKEFAKYHMLIAEKDKAEQYLKNAESLSPDAPEIPILTEELNNIK